MANWFVTMAGAELGPLSDAQLRQLARDGKLAPTDIVRKEGVTKPIAAGKIQNLFPAAIQPPAPPTAPPQERGTFAEWYGRTVGKWAIPFQILVWIFYGFLWIPAWWAFALLNSLNPALVAKGKRVMIGVVCGLAVILLQFAANFRETNRRMREANLNRQLQAAAVDNTRKESRASDLTFNEFRNEIMGRTFSESAFFEQFGPPAKTIPTPDVSSPTAKKMFAVDMVHVGYLCKDEPAVVQYAQGNDEITVIAVIKAKDITLVPPSSWKHLKYD